MNKIFEYWAPIYRNIGLEPRPVKPGGKATKIRGWTKPDADFSETEKESWLKKYSNYGIGLRMGTLLPDGTKLGAIDIDHDDYVRPIQALLSGIVSGRFGSKGAVIFVRVSGTLPNSKFKVKGEFAQKYGQVVECLFDKTFCVIPPTVHPKTNSAYTWIGTPLHEVDFNFLPIVGGQ